MFFKKLASIGFYYEISNFDESKETGFINDEPFMDRFYVKTKSIITISVKIMHFYFYC